MSKRPNIVFQEKNRPSRVQFIENDAPRGSIDGVEMTPLENYDPRTPDPYFGKLRELKQSEKDELRVVCIGDLHFRKENISAATEYTRRVIEHCSAMKPDLIVLLGDILHLHGRDGSLIANFAWSFISQLRRYGHVVMLIGNHDLCDGSQFLTDKHLFNPCKQWKRITVVDKVRHLNIKGHKLVFCPYVPDGRFKEALETMKNWEYVMSADCIFAHQSFYGCKYSETRVCETGDKWPAEYPLVISGHIHTPHRLGSNIVYIGSAMQHHHGDFPTNSISLVRWMSDKLSLQRIEIPLKQKVTIVRKLESRDDIERIKQELDSNKHHDVRLCVYGSKSILNDCKKLENEYSIRIDTNEQVLKKREYKHASGDLKKNLEDLISEQNNPELRTLYDKFVM